ncbi:DUF4199 domain-containing protein [uncultured Tenacibaculum sp.]|uniref:DUF4199 domain-containing protein n=1 Tax=uncultured Tenacibaculum sp. TaxID=174713 RepID=UPI002603CAB1|nr:DUF4199 domain-containing protein [uncultured Tenacibaculum sp.]
MESSFKDLENNAAEASTKKSIIDYGLITSIASIFITLIGYAMGNAANPGLVLGIIGFVVPITLIVLGIKNFKKRNNGFLKWAQAVKVGIGITIIWGLIALTFQYVLENYIDPNILEQKAELLRTQLENWGMDEDQIEESIEKQKNGNPLLGNALGLLFFAFIGFVVSAIAGAIMQKREEDTF